MNQIHGPSSEPFQSFDSFFINECRDVKWLDRRAMKLIDVTLTSKAVQHSTKVSMIKKRGQVSPHCMDSSSIEDLSYTTSEYSLPTWEQSTNLGTGQLVLVNLNSSS